MRDRSIVVVPYGPKGAGKSWVAGELNRLAGVHHVDAGRMVLELSARGRRPGPEQGWRQEVAAEVSRAAGEHLLVPAEATGAWDSDWMPAGHLAAAGCLVLPVWVSAPPGSPSTGWPTGAPATYPCPASRHGGSTPRRHGAPRLTPSPP